MIIVTGDTQRPSPQFHNILWLYNLIKFQIERITKCPPVLINETRVLPYSEWIKTKDCPELINLNAVYIGFELSDNLKASGVKYLDVRIHPIRFMDDLVIGVESNFCDVRKFSVNLSDVIFSASLVSAATSHLPGVRTEKNTALLVGQTRGDRSVIFKQKEYSLDDFGPALVDKLESFDLVLYKPHPYGNVYPEFLSMLDHVDIVSTNIYKLLSDQNIKSVFGLSSSVLCEARFFGKDSQEMLPNWWDNLTPISSKDFLSFGFWLHVLSGFDCYGDFNDSINIEVPYSHSMLRRSCRSFWGYDVLDNLP